MPEGPHGSCALACAVAEDLLAPHRPPRGHQRCLA
jgi:hypothetical protein